MKTPKPPRVVPHNSAGLRSLAPLKPIPALTTTAGQRPDRSKNLGHYLHPKKLGK